MSAETDETVRHGTANLFADLGYADAEAHLLKAELVRRIQRRLDTRGLTQVQAAKLMGMSYNKAWRAMRQAEDHLGIKLLKRRTGGADGGGSVLTEEGVQLMERFRAFLDEADADLARLYQKYFGDSSFAQPGETSGEPSSGEAPDTSSEGR